MSAMLTLQRYDGFSVSTLLPKPGTVWGSGDRLVEKAEPAPVVRWIGRHCQVADERAFFSLGAERPSLGQQAHVTSSH